MTLSTDPNDLSVTELLDEGWTMRGYVEGWPLWAKGNEYVLRAWKSGELMSGPG